MPANQGNMLDLEVIKNNLNTNIIGNNIIILDSVESTNDYLKALAHNGEQEGTVVITREQTQGKGRLGRVWNTEKDKSLALSVLLRPDLTPDNTCGITPLAGLGVCKAINDFCLIDSKIKWPNDIIVGRKKLCGILAEMEVTESRTDYVVVGVGINIYNSIFTADLPNATSVFLESGRRIDINKFIATLLNTLEQKIINNHYTLTGEAVVDYRNLCATIGRQVMFNRGSRDITGMAAAVNNKGELEVMLSDGTIATVNCGEVTVQGIY